MHWQGEGERALRIRGEDLNRRHQCPRARRPVRAVHQDAGNPYDGHTLKAVIEDTEKFTGCAIERAFVDKGYHGHDVENLHRIFISGQKRGVFGIIERDLRRRSAIRHMKGEGHLGRCYLKGREGDAANAILTAVGHNLRFVLTWLRILLRLIPDALLRAFSSQIALKADHWGGHHG